MSNRAPVERWRVLPYDVGSSTRHFALSDALARHVIEPTIWWHATAHPTLILGTGQPWDAMSAAACAARSVQVVRRQAGGTAVFAGPGVLGLDVALPADHRLALADVVEAYRWLGEVWCGTAQSLGAPARLVSVEEARAAARENGAYAEIVRLACFGSLSPHEVVVDGRKLVGLAQVRRRGSILLQSGIHRHFDAEGLADLLVPETSAASPSLPPRRYVTSGRLAATEERRAREAIAGALRGAAVGWEEATSVPLTEAAIMTAFEKQLQRQVGIQFVPGAWTEEELAHADLAEQE